MDGLTLNADGTITVTFDDTVTRVLRRPKLREYRECLESLGDMRSELLDNGDADDTDDVPNERSTISVTIDKVIGWADHTIELLSGEGLPRTDDNEIDEDRLPVWIMSSDFITEMVQHWQSVPLRRGGR